MNHGGIGHVLALGKPPPMSHVLLKLSFGYSFESSNPIEFSFSPKKKSSNCLSEHYFILCPRAQPDEMIHVSHKEDENQRVKRQDT